MAINKIQERYNSLRTILVDIVTNRVEVNCIIAGQNAPRPALPYCSLALMDAIEEVGTHERRIASDGSEYSTVTLEFQVDVAVFTDSGTRFDATQNYAFTVIEDLKKKLNRPDVTRELNSSNLVYLDGGLISSSSTILNTTFEPKAVCTLNFRTTVVEEYDDGAIDYVSGLGSYTNANGDTILSPFNNNP